MVIVTYMLFYAFVCIKPEEGLTPKILLLCCYSDETIVYDVSVYLLDMG